MDGRASDRSAVLLRHDVPGKAAHFDWMLERAPAGEPGAAAEDERRLVAFRLNVGVDPMRDGAFAAQRIGEHRAVYLHKEGDLGRGRGTVTRLWLASLVEYRESDGELAAALERGGALVYLLGHPVGGDLWRFVAEGGSAG